MNRGKLLAALDLHYDAVNSIGFSPDNEVFASASADRSIILGIPGPANPSGECSAGHSGLNASPLTQVERTWRLADELGKGRIIELQSSL